MVLWVSQRQIMKILFESTSALESFANIQPKIEQAKYLTTKYFIFLMNKKLKINISFTKFFDQEKG
jgi:hypothetical protein